MRHVPCKKEEQGPRRIRPAAHVGTLGGTERETRTDMPVVSTLFGIVVRMFYREHGIPHFHAEHQGQQATFTFDGKLLAGSIQSRTALRLTREWALAPAAELEANWKHARAGEPLERIAPLD